MRSEISLFRISAADEDETGGVADAQAFALDDIDARGGCIEEEVDQVVLQQIDLINIEKAAVCGSQEPGLEVLFPRDQGLFDVERAANPILGGAQRKIDHRCVVLDDRRWLKSA